MNLEYFTRKEKVTQREIVANFACDPLSKLLSKKTTNAAGICMTKEKREGTRKVRIN